MSTCNIILQQQGKAYPRTCAVHGLSGCPQPEASPTQNGGSAFPYGQISEATGQPVNSCFDPGMSLRDWFAGKALPSVIECHQRGFIKGGGPEAFAETAYHVADAMLAARLASTNPTKHP